ncbi:MAG: cyanophycin synthetase, partial [Flavobacterium sp.]
QGRWQQLHQFPTVMCDTAHNKQGLQIVLKQVQKANYDKLHVVLGVVNDKDLDDILPLFPKNAIYYFCKPNMPRGLDATVLSEKAREKGLIGKVYPSIPEAYQTALRQASKSDFIYIGGSTFVVAEIL